MRALVADIGGTNARFATAGADGLGEPLILPTATPGLIEEAVARLGLPEAFCLAVAGPVRGGRASLTNIDLMIDGPALARSFDRPVRVINDFTAISYGMLAFDDLLTLGEGTARPDTPRAAIGPGSGCGMGVLVPTPGGWYAVASEGGHADLAPGSALETELWNHLSAAHGQVCWETVLSGSGLVRLYQAMCQVWGVQGERYAPEDITAHGVDASDPVCHQTLETFFALLGTAAGSLAVLVCATGGVFIAGGIVPAMADFAVTSPLRRRFDERGLMQELARSIPLHIVRDGYPGLIGAHAYLEENADG